MLATALTLNGSTVNTTYSLRSIVDGKAIRGDATAPVGTSRLLTVSHSLRDPKDKLSPKRHLARIDWSKPNSVSGQVETLSVYVVAEVPQTATFTSGDISDVEGQLTGFIVNQWAAFLNDEP